MLVGSVQPQSLAKYKEKFKRWQEFCALVGQTDEFLEDMTTAVQKTIFVCAWAAWAREDGRWCGDTTIQGLAVVRTLMIHNFSDHAVFDSPTIKALRRALSLSDWWDEARENKEGRLPYTLDMVYSSAIKAVRSNDLATIMLGTAVRSASTLLLRIGEYGDPPEEGHPDHRILSKNVAFYLTGSEQPLNPRQLRGLARTATTAWTVQSVSLTLAGCKTDKKRHGITFSFDAADFDMNDKTNAVAMWTRWACLATQDDEDPFFSYRNADDTGARSELSAAKVTTELRCVARAHGIPEDQLYRVNPHSIRVGMASHLHNQGVTTTVILQMGRWSPKSSAAPRYQQLGRGACAQVARATDLANAKEGQTSADTIRTLIHVASFRDQYKTGRGRKKA